VPTGDTIKIAVVASFSGPAALVGQVYWASAGWAVHDINKRGGIFVDGKKKLVELIKADHASKPDVTKKVVERMVLQEKVHVLWGTDSIWYGTPQWQIEAFRRFEIPQALVDAHGYTPLTRQVKEQIFGLNAARVFSVDVNAARNEIPQDYLNVARVLNLSEWKVFTTILFPAVLPYMITGVRLSIGVAWLVIVAAEMLTGGVGIGFWVWDEWNNLKVEHIIIAIFTIGMVGLLLEQALVLLARRFSYAA